MLVVPASMTLEATSSNEVVSLGYIVVIDSELNAVNVRRINCDLDVNGIAI